MQAISRCANPARYRSAGLWAPFEGPARWDGHGLSDRAGFGARRNRRRPGVGARRNRRRAGVRARRWGRFGDRLGGRASASASVMWRRLRSRGRHRGGCAGDGCRRRCGTRCRGTRHKLEHRVRHESEQYRPDCAGGDQRHRAAVPRRRGLRRLGRVVVITAISSGLGWLGVEIGVLRGGRHEGRW